MLRKRKSQVLVYSDLCSGCMYCQLACAFVKTGEFNPSKARIRCYPILGKARYGIYFLEECDGCGFCARYCFYGVLNKIGNKGCT